MADKIVDYYRGQYLQYTIDVNYPDIGKKTYTGYRPIIVSNQYNMNIEMPNKGDIITMDGKDYRVLKIDKTVAEVLAMYDTSTLKFDTNSSVNNTYEGKNIDTYCNNTYYNALSTSMKSAIVDKTFTQDSWKYDSSSVPTQEHYTGKYSSHGSGTYYLILVNAAKGASITRHCYCLSVQDVLDYLDVTTSMAASDTTLTDMNVWMMFWNVNKLDENKHIYLRSASTSNYFFVFNANGFFGRIDESGAAAANDVHPAFQIDLSKVEFTKVEE